MAQKNIMSKLLKSKILLGVMIVAVMVVGLAMFAAPAKADCSISMTLKQGMRNTEVSCLQEKLGVTPQTGYFGTITKAAVKAYQANHSPLVADGVVGAMTRATLATQVIVTTPTGCENGALFNPMTGASCSTTTTLPAGCVAGALFSSTTGLSCTATTTVTNGVGTVEEYKLLTTPANLREVGQGASDVKVAGISIEAGTGSDLTLTAVKVVFNEGTANHAFKKYAKDVSIMLGDTKLATIDALEFTSDNSWTKTIALSSGAIVKAGKIGNLYVAVSGISNLDSADAGDTWTVDVTSIRWVDGQGAMVSEDPTTALRTFSFESLATATDLELKLTEASSNPVSQVVQVSTTATTDNVVLFKGNLKAVGGELLIKDITVGITPSGTGDASEIASQYTLKVNGTEVQSLDSTSCSAAGDCDGTGTNTAVSYVFDAVDTTIPAGSTYTVEVLANLYDTSATFVNGDTLTATIAAANIVAEDVNGDTGATLTGTVVGKAQAFYDKGIKVTVVGTPTAVVTHVGDPSNATDSDQGTFAISFNVTAFNTDVWIDKSAPLEEASGSGESALTITGTNGTTVATITSANTLTGTNGYKVLDGTTEKFTITTNLTAGASTFFDVALNDLVYAITDVDGNLSYTFDMGQYKTPQIFLNYDAA